MGTSFVGQWHGKAVKAFCGADLVAVADNDPRMRAEYIDMMGPLQEFDDYRDMIKKADLDAVIVGLPTHMHYPVCMESLDAGLHVICEKPPTSNASEMVKIARKAEKAGLVYMFARQGRFTKPSLKARELVQKGRLGQVYHANATWIQTRTPGLMGGKLDVKGQGWRLEKKKWRLDKAKGGGVLLDLGIHVIDGAWFVMGCPRPVEVVAGMHCAMGHLVPKAEVYSADDAAMGMIRFENGATLQFSTAFSINWTHPHLSPKPTKDGKGDTQANMFKEITVIGSHAGVDITGNRLMTSALMGVKIRPLASPEKVAGNQSAIGRQMADFLNAILNGTKPTNSADQAVMLMQMLEGLAKSGETGRAVQIKRKN